MKHSFKIRRHNHFPQKTLRRSSVWMTSHGLMVHIHVDTRATLGPRYGRLISLAIFRSLSPALRSLGTSRYSLVEERRQVSFHQACKTDTAHGRLGFVIRMRRLKLGLTQRQVARTIRVSRTTLSRIEKGHVQAHWRTYRKLEKMLGKNFGTNCTKTEHLRTQGQEGLGEGAHAGVN